MVQQGRPQDMKMMDRYELHYGYVHCRGKTTYCAGYTETEAEALSWVKRHQEGKCRPPVIPLEDPVRYCLAAYCPFKRQKAWYAYRELEKP